MKAMDVIKGNRQLGFCLQNMHPPVQGRKGLVEMACINWEIMNKVTAATAPHCVK